MRRKTRIGFVLLVVVLAATSFSVWFEAKAASGDIFLPLITRGTSNAGGNDHSSITAYLGPETCVNCHRSEAEQMHASVHYQQSGPTPYVLNIAGTAGKNDGAFNTYCGTIEMSRFATCAGCHVGYGQKPQSVKTVDQLNNIDCLLCQQEEYARTAAGPFEQVPAVGASGNPTTISAPIEDENGFHHMPDESKMNSTILEAARNIHTTTRKTCLRCHAYASGSDGGKRGDLLSVTINPPRASDIHMSPDGQDFTCAECHDAGDHRIRGRGLDLRPNDVNERFICEHCHTDRPHEDYSRRQGQSLDKHASRVACQSCHIPTFAKDISTEMQRNWQEPF